MTANGQFILGIDGGGTKTLARLVNIDSQQSWQIAGGASSLTNNLVEAGQVVAKLIDALCAQAGCAPVQVHAMLGLAGAGSAMRVAQLQHHLPRCGSMHISTDATTSLYGAGQGEPVCIVALGTGSVAARLNPDGSQILQGGWGFIAGDEGGGARLGLHGLQHLLADIDRYAQPRSRLSQCLAERVAKQRDEMLGWIAEAKAGDYAALAPLVLELHESCPAAQQVMQQHLRQVEQMIYDIRGDSGYPVALLGGLAAATARGLPANMSAMLIAPKGDALDGACYLARRQAKGERWWVSK